MAFIKSYLKYFELVALLALIVCVYVFGYHTATNADKAAQLAQVKAQAAAQVAAVKAQADADEKNLQSQLKTAADNAAASQAIAVANAVEHTQQQVVYHTITQQVTKYVSTHPDNVACNLDDDGLRIWREANSGKLSTSTAEH
jgi:hypothetical protein